MFGPLLQRRGGLGAPTVGSDMQLDFSYQGLGDIFTGEAGKLEWVSRDWVQNYEQCRGEGRIRVRPWDRSISIEFITPLEEGSGDVLRPEGRMLHDYFVSLRPGLVIEELLKNLKSQKPLSIPSELFPGEWRPLVGGLGVYLEELDPMFLPARTRGQQWGGWGQGLMTYQQLDEWINRHPKETRPNIGFYTWPAAVWVTLPRPEAGKYGVRLDSVKAMEVDQGDCYVLDDEGGIWKFNSSGKAEKIEWNQLPSAIKQSWTKIV